ncbi:MAG: trimethylamine methyltransferase family protein [Lentisphaeria bacterium]|nr:trimethylamine methyltransferase family protein [Lentisphaeria bacterium]
MAVLTSDAVGRIHEASLELLSDPGVRFEHDAVCSALLKAGATLGSGSQVLRIPRELVEECLERAPRTVAFADRRGGMQTIPSKEGACVWSTPGVNWWRRGEVRPITSADLADYARLLDQLPAVDGVFGTALADVPPKTADIAGLRIMADNTTKHIRVLCSSPAGADTMCRMKPVVADTPWFSIGFTAHGPLRWTHLALDIFARTAGHGIPITINGEPMAGTSGPVTLAGAAAVGNAEILAGLVVNQILDPGRPCIYNLGLAHVFDMKTAVAVTGAPENHLLAGVSAELARFYGLPSCSWVSTEALAPDAQATLEKSIGWTTHMMSRVSLVWGVGQLESELTVSPAMAVIDQEILDYVARYCRGITASDDALALDVIREVGIAGEYLSHEHTFRHFRSELYEPGILWRGKRGDHSAAAAGDLAARAEERAERFIAAEREPCLSDDQRGEMRAIAAYAAEHE